MWPGWRTSRTRWLLLWATLASLLLPWLLGELVKTFHQPGLDDQPERSQMLIDTREHTHLINIPIGPAWWLATAFLGLAALAQAVVLLTDIVALIGGAPIREIEGNRQDIG